MIHIPPVEKLRLLKTGTVVAIVSKFNEIDTSQNEVEISLDEDKVEKLGHIIGFGVNSLNELTVKVSLVDDETQFFHHSSIYVI